MFIPVKYNVRHLATRWRGTCVTAGTFALVVATFIIVTSLARGVEQALHTSGEPLNLLIMRPGVQSEGQSMISMDGYEIVRCLPGIAVDARGEPMAASELIALVNKPRASDGKTSNLQLRGVSEQSFAMRPFVRIVQGRLFRPGLREIIAPVSVAGRFQGFGLGDHPRLGRGEWTVVGLFDAQGTAFDSEIWTDCRELMQEFDRVEFNTAVVRAQDAAAAAEIKRRVEDDKRLKFTAKSEKQYYEDQTMTATPIKAFAMFLAVIMSIGASFAAMNTMYASVAGRVQEIGTLRVLGFSSFAVLVSFLIESIVLATLGGAVGCVLALPMNGIATGTTNLETFSEIVFYFTITPGLMVEGMIFAVVMGAIGGFLPAWHASQQPVLAAMREV